MTMLATRRTEAVIEKTGAAFAARVKALVGQETTAEAEIDRLRRTRFDDVPPVVGGSSAEVELKMQQAQAVRRAPLIKAQRARLRELGLELDELHRARDAEVRRLRLEAALGTTPPVANVPDHWSTDGTYTAVLRTHADLEVTHARLVEDHGQCLARSDQARTRVRESAVGRLSGEVSSSMHAKAEKTRDDAAAALATVAEQLQVHTDALVRVDRQREALETDLRAQWIAAITSAHRAAVQQFAGHLRHAGAAVPALKKLADLLDRERPGAMPAVTAPSAFDVENPETNIRRWLDLVIECRLVD